MRVIAPSLGFGIRKANELRLVGESTGSAVRPMTTRRPGHLERRLCLTGDAYL